MSFKISLVAFFILMSIGAGSYTAVRNGFYPIAAVDLNLISTKSFQENSLAAYHYFQNALFVSGSDPRALETLEARREIRRATLDKLIIDELIYKELEVRINDDFKAIAEKNVEQYIQNNKNISEGAEKIYGLSLADFKDQVLMPEAYKEILEGRMFLNKENFDEWLKNKKSSARIIILSPDLQWDGNSVKLH